MKRTLALALLLLVSSCGRSDAHHATLTVLAASSLTAPFTELGKQFHDRTATNVTFNFAASSTLARQIADGADADLFASASEKDMQGLVANKIVTKPVVFAENTLEIAIPKENRKKVRGLADLGRAGTTVVLCASTVPCGRLADTVLQRARVTAPRASREDNVRAVLSKIALGEADAGIVYVSDIRSAPVSVRGVPIPAQQNATTRYPIAVLAKSQEAAPARSFVSFVVSETGRATLRRFGFAVR